jgi:hypothetical protein
MVSQIYIPILVVLILFGCSNKTTSPTESQSIDEISAGEYTVLQTIIDSLYFSHNDSLLILRDSTTTGLYSYNLDSAITSNLQYVKQHINPLKIETMEDFKIKNLTHTYIQNPVKVHPACVYPNQARIGYPTIEVSRVGFSSDGNQAIAYIGRIDAPLAGSGCYHVLSQNQGKWVIIGVVMIWIS